MSARTRAFLLAVACLYTSDAGAQRRTARNYEHLKYYSDDYRPFGAAFFEIGGMKAKWDELAQVPIATELASDPT